VANSRSDLSGVVDRLGVDRRPLLAVFIDGAGQWWDRPAGEPGAERVERVALEAMYRPVVISGNEGLPGKSTEVLNE